MVLRIWREIGKSMEIPLFENSHVLRRRATVWRVSPCVSREYRSCKYVSFILTNNTVTILDSGAGQEIRDTGLFRSRRFSFLLREEIYRLSEQTTSPESDCVVKFNHFAVRKLSCKQRCFRNINSNVFTTSNFPGYILASSTWKIANGNNSNYFRRIYFFFNRAGDTWHSYENFLLFSRKQSGKPISLPEQSNSPQFNLYSARYSSYSTWTWK